MKKIAASLVLAVVTAAAFAQTNPPAARVLSLQDCLVAALKNNFDVRVECYEPQKALLELHAAYAGYDPTFSLSGTHDHDNTGFTTGTLGTFPSVSDDNVFKSGLTGPLPWGMTYNLNGNVAEKYGQSYPANIFSSGGYDNSSGQIGVSVTQPLLKGLWSDSTRLAISVAKNNLKLSEQGLRSQLITTVTAVENAYYELIYARENVKVQQEALALAQTQLDQDRQRVQVGSLAPLDVQQDEAQVAQSRANLIAAQNTLSVDQNALKNLITDQYARWHDEEIQPLAKLAAARESFDIQDSWNKGMTLRPDMLQAKLNLEQQGIQLKFDRNQIFPSLDLTASYGYNGAGREFNDAFGQYATANRPFYSYGAEFSVPLSNARARNAYHADQATEHQLLLKLKQLEQNVMVQIDNAVKAAESAWESAEATKQARTYAEAALDAEQKKYTVGKSTTFTVLQLQKNLTAARSDEIRALANYNQALANLAAAEGSTLQRRQLDVDLK
jgi:outer membrane protein TolC